MSTRQALAEPFLLRPGIENPAYWYPERPTKTQWNKIRKIVLERDGYICAGCGHHAERYMNIHHLASGLDNDINNLITLCVACHAVLHIGRNLDLGTIEIWNSDICQRDIVVKTRELVMSGVSLASIKKLLPITRGKYPPKSMKYAKELLKSIGGAPRAYLQEPLCAIFSNFSRWQIE